MEKYAVIVAGGKGSRMQSELPKQFMLLLDSPVLMHTLERFAVADPELEIILVLPESQISFWEGLCAQMDFDIAHKIVTGGATRFDSVKNGLAACGTAGVVAIHDGVRPLVSIDLIQNCLSAAEKHGSALPAVPITQSLRRAYEASSEPVDREGIVAVQTPQCFLLADLIAGYDQPYNPSFTDDATVYESLGKTVHLIEGEATNIKITTPADLIIAEAILGMSGR